MKLLAAIKDFERVYSGRQDFAAVIMKLYDALSKIDDAEATPGQRAVFNMAGQDPQDRPEGPSRVQRSRAITMLRANPEESTAATRRLSKAA